MKIIFVQLADETGEIAVLEMFAQDRFGEPLVLCACVDQPLRSKLSFGSSFAYLENDKASSIVTPSHDL